MSEKLRGIRAAALEPRSGLASFLLAHRVHHGVFVRVASDGTRYGTCEECRSRGGRGRPVTASPPPFTPQQLAAARAGGTVTPAMTAYVASCLEQSALGVEALLAGHALLQARGGLYPALHIFQAVFSAWALEHGPAAARERFLPAWRALPRAVRRRAGPMAMLMRPMPGEGRRR